MTSGKYHAMIGMVACVLTWIVISLVHLFWSGLFIGLVFGAILAKYPDLDIDGKVVYGHRSPLTHSALLPGVVLILAIWVREFAFLELVIYWCIAHGSHLLADIGGKASNHVTWSFLLGNGIVLILVGLCAGVYVLA
jgi:hypothetical protein